MSMRTYRCSSMVVKKRKEVKKLQLDCTPDASAISFTPLHMMLSNAVHKTDVQR